MKRRDKKDFLKNYKALRYKEQPRYKKGNLKNIHPCNIKKPLKFADAHCNTIDMDTSELWTIDNNEID